MTFYTTPSGITVSWLRSYSAPLAVARLRSVAKHRGSGTPKAALLLHGGAVVAGDVEFWDVQALRRCHVLRVVSTRALEYREPGQEVWSPVSVHLLLHEAGFAMIRLTIHPSPTAPRGSLPALLSHYHATVFGLEAFEWRIHFDDRHFEQVSTDVRRTMDAVMFQCHERLMGRAGTPPFGALHDSESRYQWLERLVRKGELLSAYPVIFGTALELLWKDDHERGQARDRLAELAYGQGSVRDHPEVLRAAEVGPDHEWFLSENRSVLSMAGRRTVSELSTYDPMRMQVIEYLTLQRSALRAVQRGTQLVITERRTITRRKLQQWQRVVAALTDDYVLHDQVWAVLGQLRSHLKHHPAVRDPGELEAQVRQNLGVFQSLIDASSDRVAIVLSGLFGVVAALSLGGLARRFELLGFATSGDPGSFDSRHLGLSIAIDLGLLVVIGILVTFVIRYAGRVRGPRP